MMKIIITCDLYIPFFPIRRQQRLCPGPLVETGRRSRCFLCTRGSDTSEDGFSE